MRKSQRILSFVLVLIMAFSNVNLNAFAAEVENVPTFEEEKGNEITVSGNGVENSEYVNDAENLVLENRQESPGDEELEDSLSDNSLELSVSVNDIKEAEPLVEEEKSVMEYDDLLDLEFKPITIDEEAAYDPQELVEIAQSMPSYLSESYDLYGDKYTSYYIYNQLDEETRIFWDAMEIVYSRYMENDEDLYNGYAEIWKVKTNGRSFAQMQSMLLLFKYTHPQYYYLSNTVYYNIGFQTGDEYIYLGFGVYEKFQEGTVRKAATAQIIALLDSWSAEIGQLENEEKKVQAIHDKICNKVDYNDEVVEDGYIYQNEEEMYFTQSAYSVFCTDLTVCVGYTQAFTWMCNAMDIEAFGVTSVDHAWNKVKVNEDWYNIDCTWNDGDGAGNVTYYFYLKNDNYYDTHGAVSSHQEEEQWLEYLPKCTLDSGAYGTTVGEVPTASVQAATPMIILVPGENSWTVSMMSATEDAKIYYTLDGKIPSEARTRSYMYTVPFTINEEADIRAIAVRDESLDSDIAQIRAESGSEFLAAGNCGNGIVWKLDSQGCLIISGNGNMIDFVSQQPAPWYSYVEDITEIVIEDGITGIGAGAFCGLYNLETVTISETVTAIGTEAFWECNWVEKIQIPESVTGLGKNAFSADTIIEAKTGSAAHNYAEENGYEFLDIDANDSMEEEFRIEGFLQESEEFVYSGKEIRQNISVYHKDKLLKENVDYTLIYRNHVNAASYDTLYAPSVTVMMKGQYEGKRTLYYTIFPREIDENDSLGYEQAIAYKEQLTIPEPVIYYQGEKLIQNKDFVCDYSGLPENPFAGNSYEKGRKYSYEVRGIGNFTGSFQMELVVVDDEVLDLSKADVRLEKYIYEYDGNPLSESQIGISYIKTDGRQVDSRYYVCRVQTPAVGTGIGYVYIEPSQEGVNAGYYGRKEIKITLVADRKIEDAVLGTDWKEEIPFSKTRLTEDGGIYQEKTNVLCYEGENGFEDLTEGIDYTAKYGEAEEVGKVTVIFYGKGRYAGTLKKTYSIVPDTDLSIQWSEKDINGTPIAYYQKDGAVPEFELADRDGNILRKGTDYNIITKNNRKLGIMFLEIVGIKNYKGYRLQADAWIYAGDIGKATMVVNDKKYSMNTEDWKSEVEIRDVNGRRLTAGKDYEKEVSYTYENMENEPVPRIGTIIRVTVCGKNNYAGSTLTGTYRICELDLKNLEIDIDPQVYTGEAVTLRRKDIHVYASKADKKAGKELKESCYEIIGYEKNTRIGFATVTLQGKGSYGGIRKCYFAIYKKLFTTASVEKIELEETNLVLGIGQTKKLALKIYPENADNKTIIWTSSDDDIVTVDKEGNVTAKKEGKVTIKAVSQNGNKTAVCNIMVKTVPVSYFELNTSCVEGLAGEKYQLEITGIQPQNANETSVIWKSTDSGIVSVDGTGLLSLQKPGIAVIEVSFKDSECIRKCVVSVKGEDGEESQDNFLNLLEFEEYSDEDVTASFNKAINHLSEDGYDTLYVPEGIYEIDAGIGIQLKSNMKLILSPDAVLKAIPNSLSGYKIISVNGVSNVTISGGQLIGERYDHGSSDGEWGMGIGLYDSKDIIISDVKIFDCWGDGIYIGSNNDADLRLGCENITITNCILDNNRRNNLSVVNGDDVTINNCTISNANGTAPEYGIDIETNNEDNPCEHIRIENVMFTGNQQGSIGVITAADDIIISNCTLEGRVLNYAGTNVVISNSDIYDNVYARVGIVMLNNNINTGSEAEDTLVASFDAGKDNFTIGKYNIDSANTMLGSYMESEMSPSGRVLRLERTVQGNKETGYYLNLSDLLGNGEVKLEADCTYRFEYVTRGYGQWGVKTDQTTWYPCAPQSDRFATGMTFYEAKDKGAPYRLIFFAQEMTKGMCLEIDSLKIYKVN